VVCSSVFQALGNGIYSMTVSVARQLLVLLPVAWLLSRLGDVNAVWYAFPIAEVVALTLCTVFLIQTNKKIIRHIGEKQET
jgi:Na+-driven multidrug efflux pump